MLVPTISRLVLAAILLVSLAPAQERCGAGTDLMVQALERVQPNASPSQLRDAVELLKHATNECVSPVSYTHLTLPTILRV